MRKRLRPAFEWQTDIKGKLRFSCAFIGDAGEVILTNIFPRPPGGCRELHGFGRTMNSLNILSARVIGQSRPEALSSPRARSLSEGSIHKGNVESPTRRSASQHVKGGASDTFGEKESQVTDEETEKHEDVQPSPNVVDEKAPLLEELKPVAKPHQKRSKLRLFAKKLVDALAESLEWLFFTLSAPGVYVLTCLYDDKGKFAPFSPVRNINRALPKRNGSKSTAQAMGLSSAPDLGISTATSSGDNRIGHRKPAVVPVRRRPTTTRSFSSATSDSDLDTEGKEKLNEKLPHKQPRSQGSSSSDETSPARRSIRIKLYNEDTARRRKQRKADGSKTTSSGAAGTNSNEHAALTVANLKSPTSPASSLRMTKYPRAPAPPRPLIPRRQPSYSTQPNPRSSSRLAQKTLVIDLDETLIHSLAKGGRMSSGHMVEVKLNTTVGYGGATLGPQHPILYYVHKRPHCDDFLRKVSKWYNLVVFTASVQEYADPVIDWLEQERKYFSGRYYRQHCTFRNGAYIKDLSSVEPDLSRVMILDNSPLSYIFHEGNHLLKCIKAYSDTLSADNAIPIEGWINDPTDNDLLHLVPMLEALQYVTDVRALLALRRGESEVPH